MKNYSTINTEVINLFNLEDIYRFTALALTPDVKGYTDTTIEQLAKIINENPRSLERFPTKLKACGIVEVESVKSGSANGTVTRNHYTFFKGKNYKMVKAAILDADVSNKAKGMLVALICMVVNNSNRLGFSKNEIAKRVKANRTTVLNLMKELEAANLIAVVNGSIIISESIIKVTTKASDKKVLKEAADIVGLASDTREGRTLRYYKRNPGQVNDMVRLAKSVINGTAFIKKVEAKKQDVLLYVG